MRPYYTGTEATNNSITMTTSGNSLGQSTSAPRRISASRLIRRLSRRRSLENNVSYRPHRDGSRNQVSHGRRTGRQDDVLVAEVDLERDLALEGEADAAAGGVVFPRPRRVPLRRPSLVHDDLELSRTIVRSRNDTAESFMDVSIEQLFHEDSGNEMSSRGNPRGGFLRLYYGLRDSFRLNRARVAAAPLPQSSDSPRDFSRQDSIDLDQVSGRWDEEDSFDASFASFFLLGGIRDSLTLDSTEDVRRLVELQEHSS